MKRKTKLLRLVMLCMLMLFSASEMWATDFTVNVKCEPTGVAKVYAKYETEAEYTENQKTVSILDNSGNFNLKYDNLQEGYTFLGWSKGAPSTNASDMVSTDQVATVTVLSSDPTVTYYANFASGSNFTITKDADAEAHGDIQFNVGEGENVKEDVTTAKEGDKVTVIITPSTGYSVDEATGKWYAAVANSRRIPAGGSPEIDLLSDITLTFVSEDETTGAQTYTFEMARANVQFNVTYKHRHIWDFSVSPEGTQLIATCQNQSGDCDNPTEITEIALPEELVYGVDCEAGVDLEAFNAALGGEAEAELVSAVYTGTLLNGGDVYGPTTEVPTLPGDYVVTVTVSAGGQDYVFSRQYTLNQKVIDNLMIQPIADCVYDGQVQSPDVVVKYGDIVLTLGTDYVVRYSENVNAGVGTVAVYGIENYAGVSYGTFNILKKELTADMIEVIADQSYTGQAVEPAVVVKYSDNLVDGRVYVLEPGHDYTVSYENNVEVGTATVIVTAADGNYSGEIKATFNIVGTTGIGAVSSSPANATAKRYDLSGRKAKATKRGVVIIDGKKVVIK